MKADKERIARLELEDANLKKLIHQLLYDAMEFKKGLTPAQHYRLIPQRTELVDRLNVLLQSPILENMKELQNFHKRMNKYKIYIFTFL